MTDERDKTPEEILGKEAMERIKGMSVEEMKSEIVSALSPPKDPELYRVWTRLLELRLDLAANAISLATGPGLSEDIRLFGPTFVQPGVGEIGSLCRTLAELGRPELAKYVVVAAVDQIARLQSSRATLAEIWGKEQIERADVYCQRVRECLMEILGDHDGTNCTALIHEWNRSHSKSDE